MARVRTEARREEILAVASEVFADLGYDAASMSEIARRLGGSKGTLYGYFSSKEELFIHVILKMIAATVLPTMEEMAGRAGEDPRTVLTDVGRHMLLAVTAPDAVAAFRLAVVPGNIRHLGQQFFQLGPGKAIESVSRYLSAAAELGKLDIPEPGPAAYQLQALYEAETTWRRLLGFDSEITREEIDRCVKRAVDVFLAAYGVKEVVTEGSK